MRRFLITSDKYPGEAEVIYSLQLLLKCIDMRNTVMPPEIVAAFKKAVPPVYSEEAMKAAFTSSTTVVEADFEISLDDFKREYPYSRNYHLLAKRWEKMSKTEQVQAYYAAIEYRKYGQREAHWYKFKIADTWLANKEYLNEWKKM